MPRRDTMREIEEDGPTRHLARGAQNAHRVETPIRHHLLFGNRVDAVSRRDQRRAVSGDVTILDRAPGLEQLGGDGDVDVAGTGIEAENRPAPGEHGIRRRKDLDIIGRRAGALRDARDRGTLHGEVGRHRSGDQPVRQNAAALAAESADQDGKRPRRHERACDGASPPRRRSAAIARSRQPAIARSNQLAFCTMSAR